MKAFVTGLLAATILATSVSASFAGQPIIKGGSRGHFRGGGAFASPMRGGHGFGARSGAVAYRHGGSRHWDGHHWVYYGDPDFGYDDPSLTGPGAAAALFGFAALGILQAAGNR